MGRVESAATQGTSRPFDSEARSRMQRMQKSIAALGGLLMVSLALPPASAVEPDERGLIATLPPVGQHWVWVADRLLAHNLLFDGDSGEVLGSIPGGTTIAPKPPLHSAERGEFYSVEIDYARGLRGAVPVFVWALEFTRMPLGGKPARRPLPAGGHSRTVDAVLPVFTH